MGQQDEFGYSINTQRLQKKSVIKKVVENPLYGLILAMSNVNYYVG